MSILSILSVGYITLNHCHSMVYIMILLCRSFPRNALESRTTRMFTRTTEETRPQDLAELIAGQRSKGMPGFDDDEFIEIVRELFDEELRTDKNRKLPKSVARANAADFVFGLLRLLRITMENIAAEATPWHAREWFLMAYEDHQGDNDDEAYD